MKMNKIKSTNIGKIGYDSKTKQMNVEFVNGSLYGYTKIPKETFTSFLKSASKGKFFNAKIKGIFSFVKLN